MVKCESWLQQDALVAVAPGDDGFSGLPWTGAWSALRDEITRISQILFTGRPGRASSGSDLATKRTEKPSAVSADGAPAFTARMHTRSQRSSVPIRIATAGSRPTPRSRGYGRFCSSPQTVFIQDRLHRSITTRRACSDPRPWCLPAVRSAAWRFC